MFTILKVDVVCDVAMTSLPNVLMTELRDVLYNQCIDNRCCYSFFIYPTGQIMVCKIRFVSTGEDRGIPCLVCKKVLRTGSCHIRLKTCFTVFLCVKNYNLIFQCSGCDKASWWS